MIGVKATKMRQLLTMVDGAFKFVGLLACITSVVVVVTSSWLLARTGTTSYSGPVLPNSQPSASNWVDKSLKLSTNNKALPTALSGYVLADVYREQLSRAVRTYYQLAEVATHWGMNIVEPHMAHGFSGLTGLPDVNHRCFRYEDFYNVSTLYRELDRCLVLGGHVLVSTLEDFLVHAKVRQFILLNFRMNGNTNDIVNCTGPFKRKLLIMEQKLNQYFEYDHRIRDSAVALHTDRYKFKGVGVICVNGRTFSMKKVTTQLIRTAKELALSRDDVKSPASLVVVIPEWRQIIRQSLPHPFYFTDPWLSWLKSKTCNADTIPHGRMVVDAADAFFRSLNLSRPIIGIHIRIEKLAMKEKDRKGYWARCLRSFEFAVVSVTSKYNITVGDIIAIHDQGKYGSQSRLPFLCPQIKAEFLKSLHKVGGRTVMYNPTEFGGRNDHGLVSLVEKELLLQADHLITVGGGYYQRSVVLRFQESHDNQRSNTLLCRS